MDWALMLKWYLVASFAIGSILSIAKAGGWRPQYSGRTYVGVAALDALLAVAIWRLLGL